MDFKKNQFYVLSETIDSHGLHQRDILLNKEKDFLIQSNLIEDVGEEGFEDALDAWLYAKKQKEITRKELLEIHRLLMKNLDPDIAGKFRTVNVTVGERICPHWMVVESEIGKILDNLYAVPCIGKDEILEAWTKSCHIEFERLHPFRDGNGRTGRILMNWHRLKLGLDIKIIWYKDRWKYYKWFESKIKI